MRGFLDHVHVELARCGHEELAFGIRGATADVFFARGLHQIRAWAQPSFRAALGLMDERAGNDDELEVLRVPVQGVHHSGVEFDENAVGAALVHVSPKLGHMSALGWPVCPLNRLRGPYDILTRHPFVGRAGPAQDH